MSCASAFSTGAQRLTGMTSFSLPLACKSGGGCHQARLPFIVYVPLVVLILATQALEVYKSPCCVRQIPATGFSDGLSDGFVLTIVDLNQVVIDRGIIQWLKGGGRHVFSINQLHSGTWIAFSHASTVSL